VREASINQLNLKDDLPSPYAAIESDVEIPEETKGFYDSQRALILLEEQSNMNLTPISNIGIDFINKSQPNCIIMKKSCLGGHSQISQFPPYAVTIGIPKFYKPK
jgi:hypothetical protein